MSIGHTSLTAILSLVESGINKALEYDPGSQVALEKLQDKLLLIDCRQPTFSLFASARQSKIHLAAAKSLEADATLSGNLPDLIALLNNPQYSLADSGVTTQGNLQVVNDYQKLLAHLDIDWEAMLVQLSGDVAGYQIATFARSIKSWARSSSENFPRHFSQFLQDEIKIIPSKNEMDYFCREVDELRSATDRLDAKIRALGAASVEEGK